jgi:hypothetical protein
MPASARTSLTSARICAARSFGEPRTFVAGDLLKTLNLLGQRLVLLAQFLDLPQRLVRRFVAGEERGDGHQHDGDDEKR